jgi:hypothetical protein
MVLHRSSGRVLPLLVSAIPFYVYCEFSIIISRHAKQVAAEMLGQPERGHWKHCLLPEDEEARLCDQFRQDLAPFDFTLSS